MHACFAVCEGLFGRLWLSHGVNTTSAFTVHPSPFIHHQHLYTFCQHTWTIFIRSVAFLILAGTVTHLAPERFRQGAMVTPAVDMYAFGVLMFEVYCRQQPFPGLTPLAIIAQ